MSISFLKSKLEPELIEQKISSWFSGIFVRFHPTAIWLDLFSHQRSKGGIIYTSLFVWQRRPGTNWCAAPGAYAAETGELGRLMTVVLLCMRREAYVPVTLACI